ncbi:MAG: M56 family metallopeptidase [Nonlabens sp.]
MVDHLISSSVVLMCLWLSYKLLLENISWHRFKRFFLLGSLFLAAITPLIIVKIAYVEIEPQSFVDYSEVSSLPVSLGNPTLTEPIEATGFQLKWMHLLWIIYGLGVLFMGYRFVKNLWILRINSTDTVSNWKGYEVIEKADFQVPCSFLSRIYIPAHLMTPDHVLHHEKAHIDQKHSWDILLIESLLTVLWFHPLLYLYKYSIKLNHEFMADQAVLSQGYSLKRYQESLLNFAQTSKGSALAHTYNFPIIKKRFTIMKTTTQPVIGFLKTMVLIPIIAALVYSCGKEKEEAVLIDHSIKIAPEDQEDHVFGYDVNPYKKEGLTTYNQVKYKYEIQDDFTVRLFTIEGKEIDQKLNKMEAFMKWDPKKELNQLLENPEKTKNAIYDKKLIVQQSVRAKDTTGNTFRITTNGPMNLDQLKKIDPEKIILSKYFENGVEYINIMDIISFSATFKDDIIYIDNNSPNGNIEIDDKTYRYTNGEAGIKIFDQNDQEINWYEKGWDIRERLVVPNKKDMENLNINQALKNGSKIYNNGQEITAEEYREMVDYISDSLRIKRENGVNHYYFHGLRSSDKDNWKDVTYFLQNPDSVIVKNEKYADTVTYVHNFNKQKKEIPVVKLTRDYVDQMRKNPVAATILRAMKLRYGTNAAYFVEGVETLPETVMLEAAQDLTIGFETGITSDGRPALYAAKNLPNTMEKLQPMYGKLVAGIEEEVNQKEYIIFDAAGSIEK